MRVLGLLVAVAVTSIKAASINYDKVQPFAQPKPITDAEMAAVKFKPSLAVKAGCHPYPVVNAAGDTSAGLKGTGSSDGECKGSPLGSQVYSRSTWYEDKWAIMYAWFFPKDIQEFLSQPVEEATQQVAQLSVPEGEEEEDDDDLANLPNPKQGVRYDWVNLVVWIDNPALAQPTILATSTSTYGIGYVICKPPKRSDIINGTTPKVRYDVDDGEGWHTIFQFNEEGEYQDLIQWNQLTDTAREALENTDFGDFANVPFNNAYFETNLKAASTEYLFYGRYATNYSIWE
ncbi:Necrosis inducing protein NPP1 [Phytophthora megakarya]|uniref:Necrosis inducing protein NPP1 n=1 Tax=Phytophthora megakarya TaxID=4795 RepID=A0A225VKY4_9STRA|nr:Necrosis inducing protein NPP1 [Phytophthora megakarya]